MGLTLNWDPPDFGLERSTFSPENGIAISYFARYFSTSKVCFFNVGHHNQRSLATDRRRWPTASRRIGGIQKNVG